MSNENTTNINNPMNTPENLVKLSQKLLEVRKTVPYLQKKTQGHQYKFVGSSDVLGALREELDKQGLLLYPNVKDSKIQVSSVENKDRYGNLKVTQTIFTELFIDFEWEDSETGATKVVPFYAQGIDTQGEKGVGKALTYAEKYFLLKQFNIPTDQDDPDNFQQKNQKPTFITSAQVDELMGYVNQVAQVRNVPSDSLLQSISITNLERLEVQNYKAVREIILGWVQSLNQVPQNTTPQPEQSNQNNQPIVNENPQPQNPQQVEQQYQQQYQQPMNNNGNQVSCVIENVEVGTSPSGTPFAKVFTNQGQLLAKDSAVEFVNTLPIGQPVNVTIQEENGFNFIVG